MGRPDWKLTNTETHYDYRFYYALFILILDCELNLIISHIFSFAWFRPIFLQDDSGSVSGHQLPMVNVNTGRNNVLNRVTTQQDKWKRQVWSTAVSCLCVNNNFFAIFRSKSKGPEFTIQCWTKSKPMTSCSWVFKISKIFLRGGFEPASVCGRSKLPHWLKCSYREPTS